MEARIDAGKVSPAAYHAMLGLETFVRKSSNLERSLLELVRYHASQINGCAYCIDMHTKDARAAGETEQRLYGLSAWHESPYYTDRERAALQWAEVITLISETHASDEDYEDVLTEFEGEELVKLTMAIIAINGWNRLAIAFRPEVGTYVPRGKKD